MTTTAAHAQFAPVDLQDGQSLSLAFTFAGESLGITMFTGDEKWGMSFPFSSTGAGGVSVERDGNWLSVNMQLGNESEAWHVICAGPVRFAFSQPIDEAELQVFDTPVSVDLPEPSTWVCLGLGLLALIFLQLIKPNKPKNP